MQPPTTSPEPDDSPTPISDRLKRFEKKWSDIHEVLKDPSTPPLERVLIVALLVLPPTFVGLVWKLAPWYAYAIFAATLLGVCALAYRARHSSKNKSPPEPRPESEGEGSTR